MPQGHADPGVAVSNAWIEAEQMFGEITEAVSAAVVFRRPGGGTLRNKKDETYDPTAPQSFVLRPNAPLARAATPKGWRRQPLHFEQFIQIPGINPAVSGVSMGGHENRPEL